MFENLEKRRKNTLWKAFGITATLFALGLWLIVHWREQRENDRYEAEHEKFQKEIERREQPQRIQLPGMSIVAPSGDVHTTGDYLEGKASTSQPYSMQLVWKAGGPLDDADTSALSRRDAATVLDQVHAVSDTATTLGGTPAHEYRYRGSLHDVFLTYGTCGGRRITLAVSGAIHAEDNAVVVKTFECKPDRSYDLTRREVVVDAKAGWQRIDPDDRPLSLAGPGGVRLRTYHLDRFAVDGSLADFVAHFAPQLDLSIPDKSTTRNEKLLYMGRSNADHTPAALVTFRCPDDSVAMIAITGGASLNPGIELADSGRCLQLGDPMPRY